VKELRNSGDETARLSLARQQEGLEPDPSLRLDFVHMLAAVRVSLLEIGGLCAYHGNIVMTYLMFIPAVIKTYGFILRLVCMSLFWRDVLSSFRPDSMYF